MCGSISRTPRQALLSTIRAAALPDAKGQLPESATDRQTKTPATCQTHQLRTADGVLLRAARPHAGEVVVRAVQVTAPKPVHVRDAHRRRAPQPRSAVHVHPGRCSTLLRLRALTSAMHCMYTLECSKHNLGRVLSRV
jgi:hypothetical protein